MFDYQSDRHCSKTLDVAAGDWSSLITSQIDTAPKLRPSCSTWRASLITSQIDTAPKRRLAFIPFRKSLITSQIDTAPKQVVGDKCSHFLFDYQSDRHCSKTTR